MKYDLYSLKLFMAVVAHKSIARAAEAQNIATSAVSKRISDIEHATAIQLFYRKHRGVELTPAGEEFYRYAMSICSLVDRMDADMSEFAKGFKGHIRLAANTSAITQFLPEDLSEFGQKHPNIRIELTELFSEEIVKAVQDGMADMGIFSGLVDNRSLEVIPYRTDTLVAVAPKGHELVSTESVKLEKILDFNLVGLQKGSSLQAFLEMEAAKMSKKLNTSVEVMSFDGVRRMVQAGLGVAILPYGAAEPYLDSTEISLANIEEPWATRELKIIIRDKAMLTKTTNALIQHLLGE